MVQVNQVSLCWDPVSSWSFEAKREVWHPGGSASWEWTVSSSTGRRWCRWGSWKGESGLRWEALLGSLRVMQVLMWNNTSMAQGLSLLTRSPQGECQMCRSLLGAGGNSAKQNKVILRTKWLNQVKSDFRADISLTLATRFFSLICLWTSGGELVYLWYCKHDASWLKIKAAFWLVRKKSHGNGFHGQKLVSLKRMPP